MGAAVGGRWQALVPTPSLGTRAVSNSTVIMRIILRLHGADGQDAGVAGHVCGCREPVGNVRGPLVFLLRVAVEEVAGGATCLLLVPGHNIGPDGGLLGAECAGELSHLAWEDQQCVRLGQRWLRD